MTTRQEIAFHEAGHAIIAIIKGLDVESASIIPDDKSSGRCVVDTSCFFYKNVHRLSEAAAEVVAYYVAGAVAQEEYLRGIGEDFEEGTLLRICSDDLDKIEEINEQLRCNPNGKEISVSEITVHVRGLIGKPEIWSIIQQLSNVLLNENEIEQERVTDVIAPLLSVCRQEKQMSI